jgi:hypothetical protein
VAHLPQVPVARLSPSCCSPAFPQALGWAVFLSPFAGAQQVDLRLTLDILNREPGIDCLPVEGGGGANGAFLRAGLIDEISLLIGPAVDGAKGAPSVFASGDEEAGSSAPIRFANLDYALLFLCSHNQPFYQITLNRSPSRGKCIAVIAFQAIAPQRNSLQPLLPVTIDQFVCRRREAASRSSCTGPRP